ncbi:hypothetical protein E4P42_22165 [Mycobacterium sp. PS03-16]|uniref:DUF6542 domain-containing protein n=1 Tax=Mycobacterium sp. PS03-16 TaxID=2559611 RepID=UPI001073B263|nr:DUF6542 domain-containing protein [Mycobacterium sp. PS03-16]TFV55547.1 hypothetical protein E4P42_22165 [Mycobacterium sp. PS03-16]
MSGQRARSAVPADHRSVHPQFPGLPWWGAVLLAVTLTTAGFAFDAGSGTRELSSVFSACYALGCLLAVLAVRQANIFTTVIQPPLLLFFAVPGAYYLFHSSEIHGLKDLAINCGYPLIERFPLMFFTSAAVLLVGMARWYLGMSSRRSGTAAEAPSAKDTPARRSAAGGLAAALAAKVSGLVGGRSTPDDEDDDEDDAPPARRSRTSERSARSTPPRASRSSDSRTTRKPGTRSSGTSRSRRPRADETEIMEPVVDRPRRSRSTARSSDDAEPRRRSRSQSPREGRERREGREGRERREPRERTTRASREREPRESREPRTGRESREPRPSRDARRLPPIDRRDTYERPRRRRLDDYEPLEPHGSNGSSTHHPVSRVRYRGAEDGERDVEYRSRPRSRRNADPDAWEYDV